MKLSQLSDKLYANTVAASKKFPHCHGLIGHTRALIHELSTQTKRDRHQSCSQSLAEEFQVKHGLVCTAKLDLLPALLKDEAHEVFLRACASFSSTW